MISYLVTKGEYPIYNVFWEYFSTKLEEQGQLPDKIPDEYYENAIRVGLERNEVLTVAQLDNIFNEEVVAHKYTALASLHQEMRLHLQYHTYPDLEMEDSEEAIGDIPMEGFIELVRNKLIFRFAAVEYCNFDRLILKINGRTQENVQYNVKLVQEFTAYVNTLYGNDNGDYDADDVVNAIYYICKKGSKDRQASALYDAADRMRQSLDLDVLESANNHPADTEVNIQIRAHKFYLWNRKRDHYMKWIGQKYMTYLYDLAIEKKNDLKQAFKWCKTIATFINDNIDNWCNGILEEEKVEELRIYHPHHDDLVGQFSGLCKSDLGTLGFQIEGLFRIFLYAIQ